MGHEEYQELASFLKRFIRRFKLFQGIEGICLTAICALLLFALGPGVQQIKGFVPYAPLAYSIVTAAVLLFLVGWTVIRLCRRFSQERAALYIEQKQPKLRNNLINSLQLYPEVAAAREAPGFSTSMVLALLRTTRKQLSALQVDQLIDTRRVKASLRLLAALFIPVLAMVLFNPSWVGETFSLLTRPLDHLPPSKTAIEVNPKGLRVVRGSPVTIQAATSGAIPKSLELIIWSSTNERGEPNSEEKVAMENLGEGKFTATLSRLAKTLRYRVATGAFSSPTYTAEAIDPPEIGNASARRPAPGFITTVAGTGIAGYSGDQGPAVDATIDSPGQLAVDAAGNVFFVDVGRIRRSTPPESSRRWPAPRRRFLGRLWPRGRGAGGSSGVAVHDGIVYIGDEGNYRIRMIVP